MKNQIQNQLKILIMIPSKIPHYAKRLSLKIYFSLLLLVFAQFVNAQSLGALEITPAQYALLPRPNWTEIKSYSTVVPSQSVTGRIAGIRMLDAPPVGDQGSEGSCVGWGVGYSAMGILTYPKSHCWDNARRSPNYVYNQIKANGNCGSGAYPTDGLNLVKNQGDCSWNLMPYVDRDCATQPNTTQRNDAAQNKAINWAALNTNDVDGIKQALDLGFPVVTAFRVTQAFKQMGVSGGVWSTNGGTILGGHCTCIVGYDDTRQQFKVQNQWGNLWGDNGFYWVTYNLVRQNCYEGVYIVYGSTPSAPIELTGSDPSCGGNTIYFLSYVPCNATITLSVNNPTVSVSRAGSKIFVTGNGFQGAATLTVTVSSGGTTSVITKVMNFGAAPLSGYSIAGATPVYAGAGYVYTLIPPSNVTTPGNISWRVPDGWTILSGQGTPNIHVWTGSNWGYVQVDFDNSCGQATGIFKTVLIGSGGPAAERTSGLNVISGINLYPNPSTGQFAVELVNSDNAAAIREIRIKDKFGSVIYDQKFKSNQKRQTINLYRQGTDIYMVEVFDGTTWSTQKLSLQK